MSKIQRLHNRLANLNIKVEFIGNYPWVYLASINGKAVTEKAHANHGYTIAFEGTKPEHPDYRFTDIPAMFKLIRKYIE